MVMAGFSFFPARMNSGRILDMKSKGCYAIVPVGSKSISKVIDVTDYAGARISPNASILSRKMPSLLHC